MVTIKGCVSIATLAAATMLVACSSGSDKAPATETTQARLLTRTIVRLGDGGKSTVKTVQVTQADQDADLAKRIARSQAKFAPDSLTNEGNDDDSCWESYFEAWDGTDYTGSSICFYNTSSTTAQVADLANYYRAVCGSWPVIHFCDPWFESGTVVIQSLWTETQGACISNNGSGQTEGSSYENWCDTNCTNGSASTNVGSLGENEFLWLDYASRETYQVCAYSQ